MSRNLAKSIRARLTHHSAKQRQWDAFLKRTQLEALDFERVVLLLSRELQRQGNHYRIKSNT